MIDTIWQGAIDYAQTMSHWETAGVILGVAYLLFAMRQSQWCWYAAFGSTAIFTWLFFDVSLLMESALNLYYLVMAVYGWYSWRNGSSNPAEQLPIQTWRLKQHLLVIGGVIAMSLASGYLLTEHTGAVMPYLDSFTTWGAVITTWMVTRKVLENWLYWLVIDAAAIVLYVDRELYLTAVLMMLYLVLAIIGWISWRRDYLSQQPLTGSTAASSLS